MKDLKENAIRTGLARLTVQVANFAFCFASLLFFARLLGPSDSGLVGTVKARAGV